MRRQIHRGGGGVQRVGQCQECEFGLKLRLDRVWSLIRQRPGAASLDRS